MGESDDSTTRTVDSGDWRDALPSDIPSDGSYHRPLLDEGVVRHVCLTALRSRPDLLKAEDAEGLVADIAGEMRDRGDPRSEESIRASLRREMRWLLREEGRARPSVPAPLSALRRARCAEMARELAAGRLPKGLNGERLCRILEELARLIGSKTELEIDQTSLGEWSGVTQRRVSDALALIRRDHPRCRLSLLDRIRPAIRGERAARYRVLREAWGMALAGNLEVEPAGMRVDSQF